MTQSQTAPGGRIARRGRGMTAGLVAIACVVAPAGGPAGAAVNCPGAQVTDLPYTDSGSFPVGNQFHPVGVDLSYCGLAGPVPGDGTDFVVVFFSGTDPHFDCTLQASAPVLSVFGEGVTTCMDPQSWLEFGCYSAKVGTRIDVLEGTGFFGGSALVVDTLGNAGTTFTLECDGVLLPVELQDLIVE